VRSQATVTDYDDQPKREDMNGQTRSIMPFLKRERVEQEVRHPMENAYEIERFGAMVERSNPRP
jgi:hypothetical protein